MLFLSSRFSPTPEQYAAMGRLDIVMAPVDGGLTLPLPEMIALLKHVRAAIVIPMHWFSMGPPRSSSPAWRASSASRFATSPSSTHR
jgi:L-ascorbate metabolism protein UlaG (beta-lactamase superfamily)